MPSGLQPPETMYAPHPPPAEDRAPIGAGDAVAAWLSMPGARHAPTLTTPLQVRGDSAVYRLHGAARGSDVIAKAAPGHSVERFMYECLLHELGIAAATYLGGAEGQHGEWIFLEDVGGEPYNWSVARHREAAARWLFAMHVAAASCQLVRALPYQGLSHWRPVVHQVRDLVSSIPGDATTASTVIWACDAMRNAWSDIESVATLVSETLVHGDLVPKNIRVLDGGARVCPIDWGSAAYGAAAIDFAYVDARAYWLEARDAGQQLSLTDVRRLSSLGRLLRNLMLVSWLCEDARLDRGDLDGNLSVYARWIGTELRFLRAVPA